MPIPKPESVPVAELGRHGYIYSEARRVVLATLTGWSLTTGGPDGPAVVRIWPGPDWIDGDVPPDGERLYLALERDGIWRAGAGLVRPRVAPWTWVASAPLDAGPHVLDEYPVATAASVPLPGGHTWHIRQHPRVRHFERWQALLRREGASVKTWHLLIRAYDNGWTLAVPSPAGMKSIAGWNRVPRPVVEAMVDYLVSQAVAGMERVA